MNYAVQFHVFSCTINFRLYMLNTVRKLCIFFHIYLRMGCRDDLFHMEQKRSYSESVVFLLNDQSKTANDRESRLSYQKLSMGSEGDDREIDTFALIYWNHFFEAGPFLFHMPYTNDFIAEFF